jgi:hypothetical protein
VSRSPLKTIAWSCVFATLWSGCSDSDTLQLLRGVDWAAETHIAAPDVTVGVGGSLTAAIPGSGVVTVFGK